MYKDGRAPRVMICTISTLHPAYLHAAHVCRHGVLGCVQVGRTHHRNRADHDPRRVPDLRYSQGPALAALASVDTRSRKLGHPRSGSACTRYCTRQRVQVGRMRRRNRADHDPGRLPVLRHSRGPALTALRAWTRVLANFVIHAPSRARALQPRCPTPASCRTGSTWS